MASCRRPACFAAEPLTFHPGREGIVEIGAAETASPSTASGPRHRVFLPPHAIASRRVTNREWREFIADGGYRTPTLWLSDGWDWVQQRRRSRRRSTGAATAPSSRSPAAARSIRPAPVAHVSFFEADAFARWAGARLPTEAEWERLRRIRRPASRQPARRSRRGRCRSRGGGIFGDVWEWTQSAFAPYPGFAPAPGAVGEYNGKFMCGQMVLKGASCATPRGHSRASYRNFFPPGRALAIHGSAPCSRRLTTPDADAFRDDVLAGLAAPIPAIPARWLYDRAGPSCSTRSPACRLIIRRGPRPRCCMSIMPEIAARDPDGRGGGRVRRRIGDQDPDPARSDRARRPTCRSTFPATIWRTARPQLQRPTSRARRCSRSSPTSPGRSRFPAAIDGLPKLGFFPGSTIGNFVPRSATDLLRHFRELLGTGALLLIGMDRVKPVERLIAAYDDPDGVTARVQPQPARADQPRARRRRFRSTPSATKRAGTTSCRASKCIWSRSATSSSPSPASRSHFAQGSSIHTENSHKYERARGPRAAARRRLDPARRMERPGRRFRGDPRRGPAQPLRALIAERSARAG